MESLELFFKEVFNYNPVIATILMSMLPATEARLGIPFGMNTAIWGTSALSASKALLCGFLGSSLVVPIIALLFKPLLNLAKKIKGINKICVALENKLNLEKKNIMDQNNVYVKSSKLNLKLMFSIFLFVLLPLPLTGVYTGTMLGVILNLGFLSNCLVVISGNFFACLLMTSISSLVNTTYIIIAVLVFILVSLIFKKFKKKSVK